MGKGIVVGGSCHIPCHPISVCVIVGVQVVHSFGEGVDFGEGVESSCAGSFVK